MGWGWAVDCYQTPPHKVNVTAAASSPSGKVILVHIPLDVGLRLLLVNVIVCVVLSQEHVVPFGSFSAASVAVAVMVR